MPINQMDAKELKEKLDRKEDIVLVDCREQNEWDEGHIPGARFMPLSNLEEDYEKLDPKAEIVMQCRSGKRSMNACRFLQEQGYENLTNLSGGILEWIELNYPVTKDE